MAKRKIYPAKSTAAYQSKEGMSLCGWILEVGIPALLPLLLVIFYNVLYKGRLNLLECLGNGDLILTSATISLASLIHIHRKKQGTQEEKKEEIMFALIVINMFLIILFFPGIKMGKTSIEFAAMISIYLLITASAISYAYERQ